MILTTIEILTTMTTLAMVRTMIKTSKAEE